MNSDGSQFRFKMRPEVEFYKTDPLHRSVDKIVRIPSRPSDLLFSFEQMKKAWERNGFSRELEPLSHLYLDGDEVVVQFKMDQRSHGRSLVVYFLMSPILSEQIHGEIDLQDGSKDKWPVGCGPYIATELDLDRGDRAVYERIPNHWLDRVLPNFPMFQVKTVELVVNGDQTFVEQGLRAGVINYHSVSDPNDLARIQTKTRLHSTVSRETDSVQHWLRFHGNLPKAMREVVSWMAPLAQELRTLGAFPSNSKPIFSLHQSTSFFNQLDGVTLAHERSKVEASPDAIRRFRRIASARAIEIMTSSNLQNANGSRLKLSIVVDNQENREIAFANRLKENLQSVGIDLEIRSMDSNQLFQVVQDGNFHLRLQNLWAGETPQVPNLRGLFVAGPPVWHAHTRPDQRLKDLMSELESARFYTDVYSSALKLDHYIVENLFALPILGESSDLFVLHPDWIEPVILVNGHVRNNPARDWRARRINLK